MCFKLFNKKQEINFDHKFNIGDFVDFYHRDDIYFGVISDIRLDDKNKVIYDIDIAGQCPETFKEVPESIVIRIHKQWFLE